MLQLGICQIEFLEAPNPPIEENPASTQFIDVSELSPEEAKALGKSKPAENKAPEPTMAMNRQGVAEALGQTSEPESVQLEREPTHVTATATIPEAINEAPTQNHISTANTDEPPRDYSRDAYAPPAPSIPGELPGANPEAQDVSGEYSNPAIPDRPSSVGGHDADPGVEGLRSPDSFGRDREREYRREDDPRYNPDARKRARDEEEEDRPKQKRETPSDLIQPSKAAARTRSNPPSQHMLVSGLITLVATSVGGTLLSMEKGNYSPLVTVIAGILGTGLVALLAKLLHKYNEFMESEGKTKDYFRFLALFSIAFIPTSMLTNTAVVWRLAAFICLGVAFFHLFMAKFRPVAEKFVFLVGSYVAILSFAGYFINGQLGGNQPSRHDRRPRIARAPEEQPMDRAPATPPETPKEAPKETQNGDDETPAKPAETPAEPEAEKHQAEAVPTQNVEQAHTQSPPSQKTQLPVQQQAQAQPVQVQTAQTQVSNPPQKLDNPSDKNQKSKAGAPDSFAISQLYKAAESGDVDIVRKLIRDKGVNPNTVAENGVTALMLAAYYGRSETARYLLGEKADINVKDRQGTTALMWAVLKGNRDMVNVLVKAGADLAARRNDGDTALDIARLWHYDDIVRVLENPALARNGSAGSRRPSSGTTRRAQKSTSHHSSSSKSKSKRGKKSKFSATEDD
jgi:hypothetical protein